MLELKNIGKTFNPGTVNEKIALEGVNLHLDDGDFATIVGSNGAGKSTLFNAIAGEFIADTGTITLAGKDITFLPDYKRSKAIGRMFQDPLRGTAPHMTIEENLALAFLRASGHTSPFSRITKKDRDLFAEKLSELGLGLEDRMKQPVGLLSGGHRRPGSRHGGQGAETDEKDRGRKPPDLPDDHPQYARRADPGQPYIDDGPWPHRVGHRRRGARPHHRGRSAGPLCRERRPCAG